MATVRVLPIIMTMTIAVETPCAVIPRVRKEAPRAAMDVPEIRITTIIGITAQAHPVPVDIRAARGEAATRVPIMIMMITTIPAAVRVLGRMMTIIAQAARAPREIMGKGNPAT